MPRQGAEVSSRVVAFAGGDIRAMGLCMCKGVTPPLMVAMVLATVVLLLVMPACAAGPTPKPAVASPPQAPVVEVAFDVTYLGPPGDEDTARQLALVWGEAGGKKKRHVLETMKAVCSPLSPGEPGDILFMHCWGGGQGPAFRLLQRDGQLLVEREFWCEDEPEGEPEPPRIIYRIPLPAGARVRPLPLEKPAVSQEAPAELSASKAPQTAPAPAPKAVPQCGDHVLVGSKAQLATTPRENEDAERLALRTTEGLVAPDDTYRRIVADLAAIRASTKTPGARGVFPSFGTNGVILGMAPKHLEALAKGTYRGLDCLNSWYGGEIRSVAKAVEMVIIFFPGIYHPERIKEAYGQLPDVLMVDANVAGGAGDDITLCNEKVGGTHRYIFHHGSGDCPAGCIDWVYRGYEVTEAGQVTPLETWKRSTSSYEQRSEQPPWVTPGCFRKR